MSKFDDYDLTWWQKDDLEDVEEEFHITEKSVEELDKLATELYWKAQGLYEESRTVENKADTIKAYLELIEK